MSGSMVVNVSKTTEQREADKLLTEAIENSLRAYEIMDDWVLTDYMVICGQTRLDSDGEPHNAYSYLYRDNYLATHSALGLLDIARARLTHYVNREVE